MEVLSNLHLGVRERKRVGYLLRQAADWVTPQWKCLKFYGVLILQLFYHSRYQGVYL